MAKVIFDKNSLDPTKRVIKDYKEETLEQILDDLKVYGLCSVEINGVIPEEADLSRSFSEEDVVRIRLPLHGSSEESGKLVQTLGTIIGIIVSLVPGGQAIGAAIIAASSLVGGLIIANAVKPPKLQDRSEGEQAANIFNVSSTQNEIRKLEPMGLVLGSHRLAPDFSAQPYSNYVGGGAAQNRTEFIIDNVEITRAFTGGTIPAKWLSQNVFNLFDYPETALPQPNNWWDYPLRVRSTFNSATYIAGARQEDIVGSNSYSDFTNFSNPFQKIYLAAGGAVSGWGPTLIEHYDASDPIVIANNGQPFVSTLELLQWALYSQWKLVSLAQPSTNNLPSFTNSNKTVSEQSALPPDSVAYLRLYQYLLGFDIGLSSDPVQADAATLVNPGQVATNYRNLYNRKDIDTPNANIWFFTQMLPATVFDSSSNDFYTPTPDQVFGDFSTLTYSQRKQAVDNFVQGMNVPNRNIIAPVGLDKTFQTLSTPRVQEVRHLFHYGFGDLNIADKRIGDTELSKIFGSSATLAAKATDEWSLDSNEYHSNVKVVEGADLLNEVDGGFSGPEILESTLPSDTSNWITRETPDNTYRIEINIEGRSFQTNTNGDYEYLSANFEVQYRDVNDSVFTVLEGSKNLGSNSADPIRETLVYEAPRIPSPGKYEIRIRKRTKDPVATNEVQQFQLTSFNFFVVDENTYVAENREGLKIQATGSFNGTTQKYNTSVENKAWTFDGVDWTWETTRNPAWLFLYYARGGFYNESADGSLTYPYSPTIGWVNSADHPSNLERIFGAGLKDEDIDLDTIFEWAVFCTAEDLNCDLVVRADSSAHDVLQRIASTGRASVSYYTSQLSVVFEDKDEPVSGMFGMSNILKGSFAINYAVEEVPYKVVGKYADREDEWKTKDVEAIVPNSIVDNLNIEEIVLDGITDRARAQREVNILAARQAYQRRTYSWSTAIEGMTVRRGDRVYLSHDVTCYDQSGRAVSATLVGDKITEIETGLDLEYTEAVMIRFLDGSIEAFNATAAGNKLVFETPVDALKFPEFLDQTGETFNPFTAYKGASIEDLVFFSGPKSTPGKAVRITAVEPSDGLNTFRISAVEEDPVIWAFEYDNTATPGEDQAAERVIARVTNVCYEKLDNNKYRLSWELDGAVAATVVQNFGNTTQNLQSEGQYTMFKNSAVFDFEPGGVYDLTVTPVLFGQAYKTEPESIVVRT